VTREQKIAKARKLRAQRLTYSEIAARIGVSRSTVYRWINPERTAPYRNGRAVDPERTRLVNRIYNRTHRAECPSCGGEMNRGTGRKGGICEACHADEVDRRALNIERWWAEGLTLNEIADALGWSAGHVKNEFHHLREKGYDLPYRQLRGRS
jgi:excisionase family DNA binding protein